jgi:hypothetical protein
MLKQIFSGLGIVALIVVMAGSGAVGKLAGKAVGNSVTSSKPTQTDVEAVLIKAFRQTADQMNAELPEMLDDETRFDKVTVGPGPRVVYHHTLIRYRSDELSKNWVDSSLKAHVQAKVCTSADMKPSLQYGAIYTHAYYGRDGAKIGDFDIRRADCGFPPKMP